MGGPHNNRLARGRGQKDRESAALGRDDNLDLLPGQRQKLLLIERQERIDSSRQCAGENCSIINVTGDELLERDVSLVAPPATAYFTNWPFPEI